MKSRSKILIVLWEIADFGIIAGASTCIFDLAQKSKDCGKIPSQLATVRDSNSWVQGGKPYLLNGFEELEKIYHNMYQGVLYPV